MANHQNHSEQMYSILVLLSYVRTYCVLINKEKIRQLDCQYNFLTIQVLVTNNDSEHSEPDFYVCLRRRKNESSWSYDDSRGIVREFLVADFSFCIALRMRIALVAEPHQNQPEFFQCYHRFLVLDANGLRAKDIEPVKVMDALGEIG